MARTRPHIKVHISVADHPKTLEVWADLSMRGMLVELWRKGGEKFAGRTEDRVQLKATDRMDIAGTTDQARADQGVTELCARVGYELRKYPNRWVVRIRKFAKKQGFEAEELQQKSSDVGQELPPPNPNPNPIPKPIPREERESAPPAPVASATEVISPEWGTVVDALAAYVPSRARCIETPVRRARLRKLLKEFGPTAPVDAIHGYAALHFCGPRSPAFDPERNFTLETIWGQKVGKYLDADREAAESGMARPYAKSNGQGPSLQKTVVSIFDRIKAERGEMLGRL